MGWWEQEDSDWDVCIVAQVGGAVGVGMGGYMILLRSANVPVRPNFLLVAAGFGIGGSVGGGASLPWSVVVNRMRNPHSQINLDDYLWNRVTGTFSCQDLNNATGGIVQVGASAIVAGASFVVLSADRGWTDPRPGALLFQQRVQVPRVLQAMATPSLSTAGPVGAGLAALASADISGGFGAGAFVFRGVFHYMGH